MAFSQFVGGLAMVGLAFTRDFWTFFALMLLLGFQVGVLHGDDAHRRE